MVEGFPGCSLYTPESQATPNQQIVDYKIKSAKILGTHFPHNIADTNSRFACQYKTET